MKIILMGLGIFIMFLSTLMIIMAILNGDSVFSFFLGIILFAYGIFRFLSGIKLDKNEVTK